MVRDETVKITLQEIHEMCSKIKCIEISSLTKEKKLLCTASTAAVNFSYKRLLYLASSTYFLSFLQRFFSGNLSGDRRIIMLLTIKSKAMFPLVQQIMTHIYTILNRLISIILVDRCF